MDRVEKFIKKRFGDTDAHWLDGNCYWFSVILTQRFPHLRIYYLGIDGHFVAGAQDRYYDATGRVFPTENPILFSDIEKLDYLWYSHIIRDCVK